MPYEFRNLSGSDKDVAICGVMIEDESEVGIGVLEWCWDIEDAENLIQDMKLDPRFVGLEIVSLVETVYIQE